MTARKLQCDMDLSCRDPVSHVDNRGFAYCTKHVGPRRQGGTPCRKLRPAEIKKLERGSVIRY
jgi:hypothetical protein